MALDKLVDSSQLDADLTSVANAIRTKGGTSAQLAFPAGFVSAVQAIETGGGATPTLVTKTITENGTYNASSDNADGYSSVTVNVQGGSGLLQPFDTYEFNVPEDINYQDAIGTTGRTLATFAWHQAMHDKVSEYENLSVLGKPFAFAGKARILFSILPKNPSEIAVPDSTYTKVLRKDTSRFYGHNASGGINFAGPYWRELWKMGTNGSLAYIGGFGTSKDQMAFSIDDSSATNLIIKAQLTSTGTPMVSAGDYVVNLYDITWTVI